MSADDAPELQDEDTQFTEAELAEAELAASELSGPEDHLDGESISSPIDRALAAPYNNNTHSHETWREDLLIPDLLCSHISGYEDVYLQRGKCLLDVVDKVLRYPQYRSSGVRYLKYLLL